MDGHEFRKAATLRGYEVTSTSWPGTDAYALRDGRLLVWDWHTGRVRRAGVDRKSDFMLKLVLAKAGGLLLQPCPPADRNLLRRVGKARKALIEILYERVGCDTRVDPGCIPALCAKIAGMDERKAGTTVPTLTPDGRLVFRDIRAHRPVYHN